MNEFENSIGLNDFEKKGVFGSIQAFIQGIFSKDDDVEINTNIQTVSE